MLNGIPTWGPPLLKKFGITRNSAEKIAKKFIDHLMCYTPFLGRSENRLHFTSMIQGLLSDLKHKSIESIAVAFEGIDSVRNLTNFMSRSKWDAAGMRVEYCKELSGLLSHDEGMVTGDDTGFPKKGGNSVGVARQCCGNTGKIDNCQSGIMVGYASTRGYGLVNYELYMPKQWFKSDHADLRKKCDVPSSVQFKAKNEMLLEMIQDTLRSGLFPAKYVGVDSVFGSDDDFLDGLPEGLIYFADVHSNQPVFADKPDVYIPAYSGRGRKPAKRKTDAVPLAVKKVIEKSDAPWEREVLAIGLKDPVIVKDKCLLVSEVRNGLPGKDVWLYARKLDDDVVKYALCNAPVDASKQEIRKLALMRWSIEQCFKECKDYLGMDHYESRSWDAWHRHILLTLIAHLFIIKLRSGFSRRSQEPGAIPSVTKPVSIEEYRQAYQKMVDDQSISHPDICQIPITQQQFVTSV
jgi:SRSO17 transposase